MAEENMEGLEGLDDFGDDFGDQLDAFMEGDSEEDGDNELDSFFEDLSTIDDLEAQDDDGDEPAPAEAASDESEEDDDDDDDDDADDKDDKKPKKKGGLAGGFPLKPAIISSASGILLGIITVVILYFMASPSEPALPDEMVELPPEPAPVAAIVSEPEPAKPKTVAKAKSKPKAKPKPKKRIRYYVQVVSCFSDQCVKDHKTELSRLGYKSRVQTTSESSGMAEVITTTKMGEEASVKMVASINKKNPMAGHAFRKLEGDAYRISLGIFPDLATANRVKTYLNQAFIGKAFFDIQRSTQKLKYQKVQIGGFKNKSNAVNLRKRLVRKNPEFDDAFIIGLRK